VEIVRHPPRTTSAYNIKLVSLGPLSRHTVWLHGERNIVSRTVCELGRQVRIEHPFTPTMTVFTLVSGHGVSGLVLEFYECRGTRVLQVDGVCGVPEHGGPASWDCEPGSGGIVAAMDARGSGRLTCGGIISW